MKSALFDQMPMALRVALVVACMLGLQAAFEFWLRAPLANEVLRLQEQGGRMPGPANPSEPARVPDLRARTDAVLERLETARATDARIVHLHALAVDHGVQLRKVSYVRPASAGAVGRHEIQAELAASYPAVRQYLRALLAQDPALAIESLEFSRPPGGAGVRALVRFSMYFRAAAA